VHISSIRIENYKSFLDSEEIKLQPGFNIILGENNVGKTALLEALSLEFGNALHRSPKTMPSSESRINGASTVHISLCLKRNELLDFIKQNPKNYFIPETGQHNIRSLHYKLGSLALNYKHNITATFKTGHISVASDKEFPFAPFDGKVHQGAMFLLDQTGKGLASLESKASPRNVSESYAYQYADDIKSRIYAYQAQRDGIKDCELTHIETLKTNAENLASVLNRLQTRSHSFKRYLDAVRYVFPEIQDVTIKPIGNSRGHILIWTDDPTEEREHLALPLSESGTGIGQALALLFVALTHKETMIIIIDEPQSFLHPGAIRRLFGILKQHPQHQYIISTHSPTVISAASPSTIHLLRKVKAQTVVEQIDRSKNEALQRCLMEVGARLSDVFGADNILWVEGSTEELCFPLIMSLTKRGQLFGTKILGVKQPGDFESKKSKDTFEIYSRLSQSSGLLPPAIAFVFDRELRTEKEMEDMERQGKGKVFFTKRRMFENYLLNPQAIAATVNSIDGFREQEVTKEEIHNWLEKNKSEKKYFKHSEIPVPADQVFDKIDAAKILSDLFLDLSENRVEFDKIRHNVKLTDWLVDHDPEGFCELIDLLDTILSENQTTASPNSEE